MLLTGFHRPPAGTAAAGSARPALVFSPGNGFPVETYLPLLSRLPPGVEVHGLNPPGLGGSQAPQALDDWDKLVDDLRAYMRDRARPPVVLGGHSLGAGLSLRLAAESPELVCGLLLLDPLVRAPRREPWPVPRPEDGPTLVDRTRTRRERWPSRSEAEAALSASVGYRHWAPGPLAAFLAHGLIDVPGDGVRLACPPWLEVRIYETPPREEMFDLAERVRCPAAILRGAGSPVVHPQGLEELADALPVAAVLTVKGSHTFPMEEPTAAGDALAAAWRIVVGERPGGGG
jgi:pimeloyl-ACP methyl ester carboxylesterase